MDKHTKARFHATKEEVTKRLQEMKAEATRRKIQKWMDEVKSFDPTNPHARFDALSEVSMGSESETTTDSFVTAEENEPVRSSANSVESDGTSRLEPVIEDYFADRDTKETKEDNRFTGNPHPVLTINDTIIEEAIYTYELLNEGVLGDTWEYTACILKRTLIDFNPAPWPQRLMASFTDWKWVSSWDFDDTKTGDIVVICTPDCNFVEKINNGEAVFDESTDVKPTSIFMELLQPDFTGPEKVLGGRVLAWKVCGLGVYSTVWMDRQGHPIDREKAKMKKQE
ncbi:hypothetical protein IL306_006255 [Fusarium sp. DS 682]|nr:hypothetical protein IL306_006255 [Fusarium sp. DS 682]